MVNVNSRLYRFLEIYLFWLRTWAFCSCREWELLFVVVLDLLTVEAPRCRGQAPWGEAFSSCSSQALEQRRTDLVAPEHAESSWTRD